jgi:hypothetical protein
MATDAMPCACKACIGCFSKASPRWRALRMDRPSDGTMGETCHEVSGREVPRSRVGTRRVALGDCHWIGMRISKTRIWSGDAVFLPLPAVREPHSSLPAAHPKPRPNGSRADVAGYQTAFTEVKTLRIVQTLGPKQKNTQTRAAGVEQTQDKARTSSRTVSFHTSTRGERGRRGHLCPAPSPFPGTGVGDGANIVSGYVEQKPCKS